MRRDWNKVRAVLLALEALPPGQVLAWGQIPGLDDEEALQYFHVMTEAGLVKGHPPGMYPKLLTELTWQGHELVETLRHDSFWSQVKDEAKQRDVALTFDAVGAIALHLVKRALGG